MTGRDNGRMQFVPVDELVQVCIPPEVGDQAQIITAAGTVPVIWLGTVSNGRELTTAMKLMAEMDDELEQARAKLAQFILHGQEAAE